MSIVIENADILLGTDLEYIHGYLEISDGTIKDVGTGSSGKRASKKLDGSGFLVLPAFINAHTHIADSIGKDIAAGRKLDAQVHPVLGAKKKILEKSRPEHLKAFIRNSAISMMQKGIAAFADFREGGPAGISLLKESIAGLPIKCIALGRAEHYSEPDKNDGLPHETQEKAKQVLNLADGFGISGANENTDAALVQYRQLAGSKLVAVHAAESRDTVEFSKSRTGRSEVERVMQHLKPDIVVHMTNATDEEIALVAEKAGVVVCPRANGVLGAGVPRVATMLNLGCTVAIGTDNVMLNSPDIFREMDYIWKVTHATGQFIDPRDIIKMATVNAAKMLRLNSGCIQAGRAADLIFIDKGHIDLFPVHDLYAALVHRASQDSIAAVMIDGRFVKAGRRLARF